MDKEKYIAKVKGHAVVLGGSGGIGSEIVRALVANGVTAVSFSYGRNKGAADELAKELRDQNVKVHLSSLEQSDIEAVERFLDDAVNSVGEEIAIAVNCIGISPNVPLEEQTIEEWRKVFDINTIGCFFSTRTIAKRMKAKGMKGSIVLITSTNGINSQSQISAHYDASKAAQAHMMKILAEFYAPHGIRINGVAPGWIETHLNDTLPADERTKETAKIWSGRFASPAEVGSFVAFIAGSGGSYVYGQNMMIDGGYR
jgi:NAD(P)-dependent dehydrogenase (short-subunit alcohol dehydrogenase family)